MTKPLHALHLREQLVRAPHEHKGHGGRAVLIGGGTNMTGAIVLSGIAALYCGAGWVEVGFLADPRPLLIPEHPELILKGYTELISRQWDEKSVQAIGIGPGMGKSDGAISVLKIVLQTKIPLIIDADGLNLIAENRALMELLQKRQTSTILTPHPGEAARLLSKSSAEIESNREQAILDLVKLTGAIVVLKGQGTLCAAPTHPPEICQAGNSGMGSGGMGDTLTGILTALVAQGSFHHLSPWDATRLGVELHAHAADQLVYRKKQGPIGLTASEVALEVRQILNESTK